MTISAKGFPTGEQFEIAAGDYVAVVTEVGAGLRLLHRGDQRLVMEFPEDGEPVGGSGCLLIPWPNRIGDGRYTFDGVEQQLEITEPARDTAIHGLTRHVPWTLAERTASSVRLSLRLTEQPGYPHVLEIAAEYSLSAEGGLTISVTAVNAGADAAPYGIGSHAYLNIDGGLDSDGAVLRLPFETRLLVDDRLLPTGEVPVAGTEYDFREAEPLRGIVLDTAYTGAVRDADGLVRVTLGEGAEAVTMWAGGGLDWIQMFSGDPLEKPYHRAALAVEPMSCPPNAFVTGEGVVRLEPGDSVTHTWGIVAA